MLICMAHDQQQILPFNTPDSLRVSWKSMDWRLAGFKSRTRFEQVGELVMAVKCCGRNDGCRAYVKALIDVANRNSDRPIIRNRSHFYEVLKTARELGFIVSRDNWGEGKRAPSDREIAEARIAEVVAQSRELQRSKKPDFRPTNDRPSPDLRPTNSLLYLNPQSLQSSSAVETSSSSAATSSPARLPAEVEAVLGVMMGRVRKRLNAPALLEQAMRQAIANGCTLTELGLHFDWFEKNRLGWDRKHQPGAIHWGLCNAVPGMAPGKIWPHNAGVRS